MAFDLDHDAWALDRDAADPLAGFRAEFLIPQHAGRDLHYFVGNSLGLQPRSAAAAVAEELERWGRQAVEGHFQGERPWMHYHATLREPMARVVGALPQEVVVMNTLTVNLHLLMASFYRPRRERAAILIEAGAFPSDRHAVVSQIRFHGFDPATELIELEADGPNGHISLAAIERVLAEQGHRIAYVTLHVGLGTFRPVKSATITEHQMHEEFYFVDEENAALIKSAPGPIIAVGTTALRALESSWSAEGFDFPSPEAPGATRIFLHPGKRVRSIQGLITNFHLPESSLLMLVSALVGRERVLALYREAIEERYRFFSYGDAMFIRRVI